MAHRIGFDRNPLFLGKPNNMRQFLAIPAAAVHQDLPGHTTQQLPGSFPNAWLHQIQIRNAKFLGYFFYLFYPCAPDPCMAASYPSLPKSFLSPLPSNPL